MTDKNIEIEEENKLYSLIDKLKKTISKEIEGMDIPPSSQLNIIQSSLYVVWCEVIGGIYKADQDWAKNIINTASKYLNDKIESVSTNETIQ